MQLFTNLKEALLHLAFPHTCAGCGTDVLESDQPVCLRCSEALPVTHFEKFSNNAVEKLLWGRLPVQAASARYYFTKASLMQRLMHQFKYRGHKETGFYLGRQIGMGLQETSRFSTIEALVPLPLFAAKERARGFNQALILCNGIADVLQVPVLQHSVRRTAHTESQTTKSRVDRWQNIEGRFEVTGAESLAGKHLLLVDDVITTGATLEACGRALLAVPNMQLSIATLCVASE
ncbi:MAG TPA: phosphoribosyltransferase family protein [Chitinophagaceae bacterium]|nr:phosphoribosyltransferase family protein [Chitinophagaceae bacterium]